jgi:hypothetical protein
MKWITTLAHPSKLHLPHSIVTVNEYLLLAVRKSLDARTAKQGPVQVQPPRHHLPSAASTWPTALGRRHLAKPKPLSARLATTFNRVVDGVGVRA